MNGHLEVLQWCRAHGCRWSNNTWELAVMKGQLSILQWCAVSDFSRRVSCIFASKSLGLLSWLLANDLTKVDGTITACWSAAFWGNLEVLQWLRTEGCPWNESVSLTAATCGNLDVLKWCTANGCPWEARRCAKGAALHQQLHVVRWLEAKRPPFLARCSMLHRSAMMAIQDHLRICGFVTGACSVAAFIWAGMLGGILGFTMFSVVQIVVVILLLQLGCTIFGLGCVDGIMVMVLYVILWYMMTLSNSITAILMVLGGVTYAYGQPLGMRAVPAILMVLGGITYAYGRLLEMRALDK